MLLVCVRIDHPPHSSRAGSSIQAILPYCLPTTPAYCLPTTSLLFINDSSRLFTNDPYVNMAYCLRTITMSTWPIVYESAVYQLLLGLALVSWAFARIGVHRPSLHFPYPYFVFSIRSIICHWISIVFLLYGRRISTHTLVTPYSSRRALRSSSQADYVVTCDRITYKIWRPCICIY